MVRETEMVRKRVRKPEIVREMERVREMRGDGDI